MRFLIFLGYFVLVSLVSAWGPPTNQYRTFNTDDGQKFSAKDSDYDYDQSEVRGVAQLGLNGRSFGGGRPAITTVKVTKIHMDFPSQRNPNLDFFASSIYRSYNPRSKTFFAHPNRRLVEAKGGRGFGNTDKIGKIISVQTFERNKDMLLNRCPQLVPLYFMTRNGGQFLTADPKEKFRMQAFGWREVDSIGMCVRQRGACGADSPLLEARKGWDEFMYMTNRGEFAKFVASNRQYSASPDGNVCYVW